MLPSHILIRFSIILTSTPRSFKWSLCLRFICGNPVRTSPLPTCYMARPSHSSIFDYASKIWWGVRLIKLLNISLPHSPTISSHLGQISSSAPYSWTSLDYIPPSMSQIKFHTHTNQLEKTVCELLWLLLLLCCCQLSQAFSPWYFPWTSGDLHRLGFKFQTAVLSTLCEMCPFLAVFMYWIYCIFYWYGFQIFL